MVQRKGDSIAVETPITGPAIPGPFDKTFFKNVGKTNCIALISILEVKNCFPTIASPRVYKVMDVTALAIANGAIRLELCATKGIT